jgi:cell division septation protein DedD
VVASAGASVLLAVVALFGRPGTHADRSIAPRSLAPAEAYAIPPDVAAIQAAVEASDEGEVPAPRARSAARKVTMAAHEPRVVHEHKQAASRANASEAAPTSPPPLPDGTTRTRVRLVDDGARVRILE